MPQPLQTKLGSLSRGMLAAGAPVCCHRGRPAAPQKAGSLARLLLSKVLARSAVHVRMPSIAGFGVARFCAAAPIQTVCLPYRSSRPNGKRVFYRTEVALFVAALDYRKEGLRVEYGAEVCFKPAVVGCRFSFVFT